MEQIAAYCADKGAVSLKCEGFSSLPVGEGQGEGCGEAFDALFPDSFEVSELGKIPKGWRVCKLGDLIELAYGKALKADDRKGGNVPVFGSNGQVGWHDKAMVTGLGIVVGRKGNPGIVTWAPTDFFVIDTAFYVVPMATFRYLHFYSTRSKHMIWHRWVLILQCLA